jgi:amidase
LERAKELDHYFKTNNKLIGPLHGLPVTLKDQFHIKGLETSIGFVGWIGTFEGKKGTGKEKSLEIQVIRELWSLGAVPIGKVRCQCAHAYNMIQNADRRFLLDHAGTNTNYG